MKTKKTVLIRMFLLTFGLQLSTAFAQFTGFSYQGQINSGTNPANGVYDLTFTLYNTNTGGVALAGPVPFTTGVSNGLFTTTIDFGPAFTGASCWMEIAMRTNGGSTFTILSPRQAILPAPYATFANTASNVIGTVPGNLVIGSIPVTQLAGQLSAAQFPATVVVNGSTNVNISGTFSGNGANITGLSLQNINTTGAINWSPAVWGRFVTASSPVGGSNPNCVVAADINGDGKIDLVSPNRAPPYGLAVLTNDGSGGFALASILSGSINSWVTAADVNGDGKVDLISVANSGNQLLVLLNDAGARFTNGFYLSVGSGPDFVTTADVNGDGKIDLITANSGDNTLTVLTNNGSGGFAIASSPAVGNGPVCVATADVNGDGKIDLISANANDGTLTVLTNNGSGGFAVASLLTTDRGVSSVAAVDVNGDGNVDLISASRAFPTLRIFTGNGSGQFALSSSPVVGIRPDWLTAADVTGDGAADLICVDHDYASVTVLTNNGVGVFSTASILPLVAGSQPVFVAAADVNGDGGMDLICVNANTNTLTVFTNSVVSLPQRFTGTFIGNGAGLTNLNASNLIGTLNDAVLSTNIPRLNGTNGFTGANQFAGTLIASNAGNILGGDGSSLYNLNASGIASGTVALALLPAPVVTNGASGVTLSGAFSGDGSGLTNLNAADLANLLLSANIPMLNGTNVFTGTNQFASVVIATNANNIFGGNGSGLTNLNAAAITSGTLPQAQLPASVVTNTATGVTLAGTFSGNGNGLTNMNWTGLASAVPDSVLSTNIPRLNGTSVFTGVIVATDANNIFGGNGSGLTNLNASAISSGTLPLAQLPPTVITNNSVSSVTLNGTFSGNGNGLTNLNGASLASAVPDSVLSANIPRLNGTSVFTGVIIDANANNILGGNGSGLINLSATAITSGTLSLAQLPLTVITNNNVASVTLNGTFSGNGNGLTNIDVALTNVSGTIPDNTTWSVVGNRSSGFINPIVVIENTSVASAASPALRVLVDGGYGGVPDGALTVSANVPPGTPNSVLARFGNASAFVVTITNDGTIYAPGFVGDGSGLTTLNPSSITGTLTGDGSGLTNINANAIVGGLTTNIVVSTPSGNRTLYFTNGILGAVR